MNDTEMHLFIYEDEIEELGEGIREIVEKAERYGQADYQIGEEIIQYLWCMYRDKGFDNEGLPEGIDA